MPDVAGFFAGMVGFAAAPSFLAMGTGLTAFASGATWGAAFASTVVGGIVSNLLTSVAISALQSALSHKPPQGGGITIETTLFGEQNPETIILGRTATGGQAICPPYSHGRSNKYLTHIIEICSAPGATLERLIMGSDYVELGDVHPDYGRKIMGDYENVAWIKYYDGTQTTADPMLVEKYGTHPDRPWTADMVGTGICYAILTFRRHAEKMTSVPRYRFEMLGIPLEDPRTGVWSQSENTVVQLWNLWRGIELPGGDIYGGQVTLSALPSGDWYAAMNACDVPIDLAAGGTEAQYRSGTEAPLSSKPAAVAEELLKSCSGTVADMGSYWRIRTGAPSLPVFSITDDDIIITREQELDPFPTLSETFNGVTGQYPDPEKLWKTQDAPGRFNSDWEAADTFGRSTADLQFPTCPFANQVQRLMQAYINGERRFRRHVFALPPDSASIELLDTIDYTSARNGYASKDFEAMEIAEDLRTGLRKFSLREVDAGDYVWSPTFELPTAPAVVWTPATPEPVADFSAAAITLADAGGSARRAAIQFGWDATLDADAIRWEVQIVGGAQVLRGSVSDVDAGACVVSDGILPAQSYQVRARPIMARETVWTDWVTVTTADIRLGSSDLATEITGAISDAQAAADAAAAQAVQALSDAAGVQADHDALVAGFSGTLASAFGSVQAAVSGLLPSDFAGGAVNWQAASVTLAPGANTTFPVAYSAALLANAVTLGPANNAIAPHAALDVRADRVYEIEARGIVTSGGSLRSTIGIYSWDAAGTLLNSNLQAAAEFHTAADGVFTSRTIVAGADLAASGNLVLNASAAFMRPHFRANSGGLSAETVQISRLAIRDITGLDRALATDARLTSDYYSSAQTDQAISASLDSYSATITLQDLTQVNAWLVTNYYTRAGTDGAIAAAQTTLRANINALGGQITDIQGLDIAALTGTAFGAFLTELDVQADGQSAVVLAQGSAIADLEGNASAGYLIRAQAGGAVSLIDLVAADDGVTPPTSVVRISATDILLDGSVAMSQLVVTDLSGNLLGNGDFAAGDLRGWTSSGAISVIENDGSTNAHTAYFARYEPNVGGAAFGIVRVAQPCVAGDRLVASFWYLGASTSSGILRLRATWIDRTGAILSTSDVSALINGVTGGWQQTSGIFTAPASATSVVFSIFRAGPGGGYTGEGALWVADASVIRQRSGAVLITPNSVSANEMVAGTITAGSGILATAAVGTLTIAGNAVTLPVTSYTAAEVLIANSVETTIAQLTIARFAGQPTRIGFCCGHYKYGGEYTRCDFILYRGATELFRVSEQILGTAEAAVSFFFSDSDLTGGTVTYYVKAIPTFQGPAYARRRSIEAHIYKR